jgi:hypothetical protein
MENMLNEDCSSQKEDEHFSSTKTRGVSHRGLANYIKKVLQGKRRIMKLQIFHHAKIIIFKKLF